MRCASVMVLALVACKGDLTIIEADNDPPEISLATDQTSYLEGEEVLLTATIRDDVNAYTDLIVALDVPSAVLTGPTEGTERAGIWTWSVLADSADASLAVTATDTQAASSTESVTLQIDPNEAPTLSIDLPVAATRFAEGSTVTIEVNVSDAEDPEQQLALTWAGLSDLTMAPATPDASGFATFDLTGLANGSYTLQATVTDSLGAEVTRSRTFELVDPDGDNDGDLATEFGGTDCNDGEPAINGSAEEICDAFDNDCDGQVNNNATNAPSWYTDGDLDGYGLPSSEVRACTQPIGMISQGGDCDDGQGASYPGNPEVCDGLDNDCLNGVDDGMSTSLYYLDNDNDSWGAGTAVAACVAPPNHVTRPGDCDDGNTNANPDQVEVCNGINDDCNNGVDEGLATTVWYYDGDADTYGDANNSQTTCDTTLANHVDRAGDCNDGDGSVHPNQVDNCDGVNTDCDGQVDEDQPPTTWYFDNDRDLYGDPGTARDACTQPNRYLSDNTDCDDNNIDVNPGEVEICNGVNDDCNNGVDEGLATTVWYYDGDSDTYGDPNISQTTCDTALANHVAVAGDCNDGNNGVHPNQIDDCDTVDTDCDGPVDEDSPPTLWYRDVDVDLFGDPNDSLSACTQPTGRVADNTDCDDNAIAVNPDATEVCNGINDDCNNGVDEGFTLTDYFYDFDLDDYGTGTATPACASPGTDWATVGGDCNDNDNTIHPNQADNCDTINNDCDGQTDEDEPPTQWFFNNDGDAFGDPAVSQFACAQPANYVADDTDCNDDNIAIYPGAPEVCNGVSDDCDVPIDEGLATTTYYRDADGDGHGVTTTTQDSCSQPFGYATLSDDCNDNPAADGAQEYPGNPEVCGDGFDNDCVGGDDSCGPDYTGLWTLYEPGTNNIRTVSYACDVISFSFSTVWINDTNPVIELIAGNDTNLRVNGCELGWDCDGDGMFGPLTTGTPDRFNAEDSVEPFFGLGWAELYWWRGTDGSTSASSFVEFTDLDTFRGTFVATFEGRSSPAPADCTTTVWQIEGRRN